MAGMNSLNCLRNINFPSAKEVAKTTAALTLLLSMTACTINGVDGGGVGSLIWNMLCVPSLCVAVPVLGLIGFLGLGERIRERNKKPSKRDGESTRGHDIRWSGF